MVLPDSNCEKVVPNWSLGPGAIWKGTAADVLGAVKNDGSWKVVVLVPVVWSPEVVSAEALRPTRSKKRILIVGWNVSFSSLFCTGCWYLMMNNDALWPKGVVIIGTRDNFLVRWCKREQDFSAVESNKSCALPVVWTKGKGAQLFFNFLNLWITANFLRNSCIFK